MRAKLIAVITLLCIIGMTLTLPSYAAESDAVFGKTIALGADGAYYIDNEANLRLIPRNELISYEEGKTLESQFIMADVKSVASSKYKHYSNVLILKKNGDLFGLGNNKWAQLGVDEGVGTDEQLLPTFIMHDVRDIDTEDTFSYAIKTNDDLYAFGYMEQRGDVKDETFFKPTKVMSNIKKVSASTYASAILTNEGVLFSSFNLGSRLNIEQKDYIYDEEKYLIQVMDGVKDVHYSAGSHLIMLEDSTLLTLNDIDESKIIHELTDVMYINGHMGSLIITDNGQLSYIGEESKTENGEFQLKLIIPNAVAAEQYVESLDIYISSLLALNSNGELYADFLEIHEYTTEKVIKQDIDENFLIASNVAIPGTPIDAKTYNLTVQDGTADKAAASEGESVTVTANTAPTGRVFEHWEMSKEGTAVTTEAAIAIIGDVNKTPVTFTMPAHDITLAAQYIDSKDDTTPVDDNNNDTNTNTDSSKDNDSDTHRSSGSSGGSSSSSNKTTSTAVKSHSITPVNKVDKEAITLADDQAKSGDVVSFTVSPKLGYNIDSVVITDANGNEIDVTVNADGTYSFTMPNAAISITPNYAVLPQNEWRYSDVSPAAYYYAATENLTTSGILNGTGDGEFSPYQNVNRAMIATTLYRLQGKPEVDIQSSFKDVNPGDWFAYEVAWAQLNGYITGYSDDVFGPMDTLTKEQIVTVLYRYLKPEAVSQDELNALDNYADVSKISDYAKEAMAWGLANDLINTSDINTINPKETITRAELAVMIDAIME